MQLSQIYKPIQEELGQFEDNFRRQVASHNGFALPLTDYILRSSGKRLRPALVLFCAKINNKKVTPSVLSLAVAMELIHTASLIHDDVIDGANIRRNAPTINAGGENQLAVLMGDYLYSNASAILSELKTQKILSDLSRVTKFMCQSELWQFSRRYDLNLKEEEYLKIIENKTASLIASSCRNAAVLSALSKKETSALTSYGLNFGMAFQMVDDCLDFIGQEKILGKTLGLDLKRGSLTLPLIYLLQSSSKEEAGILLKDTFKMKKNMKNLSRIKKLILESRAVADTYKKAQEYIKKARRALDIFSPSAAKASLIELSELCLRRNN